MKVGELQIPVVPDSLKTLRCVNRLLDRTRYKPFSGFNSEVKDSNVFILHWQFLPDCKTGAYSEQRGRKLYISPHMTDDEIIRTFALAVKLFEEHEANEWLKFDGRRVLNPHPEGPRPDTRESGQ